MAKKQKYKIPEADLQRYLRGYRAHALPEYSTVRKHVYFSRPMQKWIIVHKKGPDQVEMEFVNECPCGD